MTTVFYREDKIAKPTREQYEELASSLARAAAVYMTEGDYGKAEGCLNEASQAIKKARESPQK